MQISTHTPAWGVTASRLLPYFSIMISTHTPAWGVTLVCAVLCAHCNISTHTPAWGVTHAPPRSRAPARHFNSHARVGRDGKNHIYDYRDLISTHTPAWGVTDLIHFLISSFKISTHTPAWGVTPALPACCSRWQFQLTRPRGA